MSNPTREGISAAFIIYIVFTGLSVYFADAYGNLFEAPFDPEANSLNHGILMVISIFYVTTIVTVVFPLICMSVSPVVRRFVQKAETNK